MEQTSSLTADSEWSPGSRVTVSLVSPIWSRKETPWMEPREFVRLGAVWLPLDSRLQSVAGGLGDGDGVGGAAWWGRAEKDRGEAGGGGLLSADIVCYLWRRAGGRNDIQKSLSDCSSLFVSRVFSVLIHISHRLNPVRKVSSHSWAFPRQRETRKIYEVTAPPKFNFKEFYHTVQSSGLLLGDAVDRVLSRKTLCRSAVSANCCHHRHLLGIKDSMVKKYSKKFLSPFLYIITVVEIFSSNFPKFCH